MLRLQMALARKLLVLFFVLPSFFLFLTFLLLHMWMCTGSVPPSPPPYMQQCLMCVIRFGCERSRGRLDADEDDGDDVDKSRVTEAFAVCCRFFFLLSFIHFISLYIVFGMSHIFGGS